jgi:hypothetical protein
MCYSENRRISHPLFPIIRKFSIQQLQTKIDFAVCMFSKDEAAEFIIEKTESV